MSAQARLQAAIDVAAGPRGVAAALAWGFAEGTLFFLVPDIVITFAALHAPTKSYRHLLAVLAGSLVAGALMYGWGTLDLASAERTVNAVPFVTDAMFSKVHADYAASGAAALLKGPTSGIPYKVYAILAPGHGIGLLRFLAMSIPARLERLVITWILFGAVGLAFRRFWQKRPAVAVALHALYWISIYAFYSTKIK